MVQARIRKSSLSATTRTLVFCDKILCPRMRGLPLNEGVKEGYPLEKSYFAAIGSSSVRTVVDR